eukprot:10082816-Prorocentrum_lima.AAC.1
MTSSLVGSEMCIRDRWKAALVESSFIPPHAAQLHGRQTDHGRTALSLCCLLYTSDAADDM